MTDYRFLQVNSSAFEQLTGFSMAIRPWEEPPGDVAGARRKVV